MVVDSKELEHERRMVYAGCASFGVGGRSCSNLPASFVIGGFLLSEVWVKFCFLRFCLE